MTDFRETELTVKPRKPYTERRPLLVCTHEYVWSELTGELLPRADLAEIVITHPSSIFVCENAPAVLIELGEQFGRMNGWQWRVTPVERRRLKHHRKDKPTVSRDVVVNYFGFRFPRSSGKGFNTFYHYPLDTITFLGGSIFKCFPDSRDPLRALIQWGTDVRQFCADNNLKVSPTTGGIAAQLLRDPRFIKSPRRKVPRATNDRARDYLPGNYYELFIPEGATVKSALYLDMTGAHHYAAARVTFPHPDRLYARGLFRHPPDEIAGRDVWARAHTPKCDSILDTHGLMLARISIPSHLRRRNDTAGFADTAGIFPPPWLNRPAGIRHAYIYSNELPMIAEYGATLEGIEAAWTGSTTDNAINLYAEWCQQETGRMTPYRRAWAKPSLLSAYGMLAARPRHREFGYREAERGEDHVYMTAGGPLPVKALRSDSEIDSPIANVIARGMVEAQVRREVLTLARDLHKRGCRVIALYADSIILSDDSPLPLLPDHWRVKTELTRLEFFNPVSFRSEEMVRLPGVPDRDTIDKLTMRQRFRAAGWRRRERAAG